MPKIFFIAPDGDRWEVDAQSGRSVMLAAVENGIEGIVAECGGSCACGTCHCHIDARWIDQLPQPDPMEADLLECVIDPDETSRLSCQVQMNDTLDGLIVHLPRSQY